MYSFIKYYGKIINSIVNINSAGYIEGSAFYFIGYVVSSYY